MSRMTVAQHYVTVRGRKEARIALEGYISDAAAAIYSSHTRTLGIYFRRPHGLH